jgi:putative effector of murein hydrolase/putative effector of murein hydrolase LrgA (UPF0299 family)
MLSPRSACLVVVCILLSATRSSWAYVPGTALPVTRRCTFANCAYKPKPAAAVLSYRSTPTTTSVTTYSKSPRRLSSTPTTTQLHAEISLQFAAPDEKDVKALVSAAAFCAIDVAFRRLFRTAGITNFPSSLGACSFLFALLLALPSKTAHGIFEQLQPGAVLLAKWLPVFFVPSLVTLPLADSVGSAAELVKVGTVIVGGFFFTLLTTAWSVTAVRKLKGETSSAGSSDLVGDLVDAIAEESPKRQPFSNELFSFLTLTTAVTGVRAVFASTRGPWTALFLLSATLNSFVYGARLPAKFKQLVHPLVTCTTLTWTGIAVLCTLTRSSFRSMLKSYCKGGLRGSNSGAGDILLFLLGPAVISLAISMYERRKLMQENLLEVGTAITVSTAGGLYGTALAARFLEIASPYLRLSLLSRNITSPLAMAIAGILGADISLAVSMVVVTGLIGANFGAAILDAVGIKDAVARGLGIGAAAHGLGTAAFANEKDAFPFAAIAMALTATAATVTVSIPLVRKNLVQLALGV